MLMRARLPATEELEDIYAPDYFKAAAEDPADGYADYLADAERHREAARRRLSLVGRLTPARGRLLDIGAAAGFFVAEAIRAGWEAEGIDIAPHVVEWGRRELDVPLRLGGVSSVEGPGAFQVVTMWDYIEHSLDPAGELARSNELLADKGLVALSTGEPWSLTITVMGFVLGPCVLPGVQVKRPLVALIEAPMGTGAPNDQVRVLAGISRSTV